jgi:hypothetical protein
MNLVFVLGQVWHGILLLSFVIIHFHTLGNQSCQVVGAFLEPLSQFFGGNDIDFTVLGQVLVQGIMLVVGLMMDQKACVVVHRNDLGHIASVFGKEMQ